MEDFGLQVIKCDEWLYVLCVSGSIDIDTAPMFRDALFRLVDKRNVSVILDVTQVKYMDSTSVGILLMVSRAMVETSNRLVLCGGRITNRILEAVGLTHTMHVTQTRQEALQLLNEGHEGRGESRG